MADFNEAEVIVSQRGWLGQTLPWFQRLVLDRSQIQDFRAGTTICRVGDPLTGMHGLVSGGLALSITPDTRGPHIAHIALAGSWIGEGSAFSNEPQRLGLLTTRPTTLLHLPQSAIREIVDLDPNAWRYFGVAAALHFDSAIGAVGDLLIRDHVKRAIAVLLRLGGVRECTQSDLLPIELDISQQDFATMANLARTTVGTVFRMLEAAGQISLSYRRVVILAPDALKAMLAS